MEKIKGHKIGSSGIGLSVLVVCILLACGRHANVRNDADSFRKTLDIHLNAIRTGNLEKLSPTVADNVCMISPQGDKIDSREKFMDFHKQWFGLKNWEWNGNILNTEYSGSLGYALIQYKFVLKDSIGNIKYKDSDYLVLIFKNSKNGWKLIHDQNTRIQN